jgi:hypothetical protein
VERAHEREKVGKINWSCSSAAVGFTARVSRLSRTVFRIEFLGRAEGAVRLSAEESSSN